MSLLSNIRRSIETRAVTVASFSLLDEGNSYLRNGYYGIHAAAYGGGTSSYGNISADRAMQLTALLSGIKLISEDIGSLPCFINEQTATGQRVAKSHPLYQILHDMPNPDMTAMQFREALTAHAILYGSGYARIERSIGDSDRIIALWPMMPYEVRQDKDRSGRQIFLWQNKTYTQREVFQLHGFGVTGQAGLNLLHYARNAIGLGLAQEEYAARFFSQDQTPPIVLKHKGPLGPQGVANVKKAWKEHHQGPDRWHAPAVLQEDMDVVQLKPTARDSQLTEQRMQQLLEVCRILRLAPHKLAELGRATWGNIGAQNVQHYNETLRPWLVRWEQSIHLWMMVPAERERFYAEHEIAGMLRGDFAMQTNGFRTLLAAGVYSINEVRGYMNLNPISGGDNHFIQINQGTVQSVAEGVQRPVESPELQPVGDSDDND